jgi:mRNA interferase MazF
MNTCKRGEIWMVNFSPGRGSEQRGARPALVIQNDIGNRHAATTIVAAITTTIKKYPVTVVIPRGEGGLKETSMVNLAQILTIDKDRLMKRIGFLDEERMEEIDDAIEVSLRIV